MKKHDQMRQTTRFARLIKCNEQHDGSFKKHIKDKAPFCSMS